MAGTKASGKRPGGRDFAPRVRSAFDRVLAKLEQGGDIDILIEEQLRADCVGTLAKAAGYVPKQIEAVITNSIEDFVTGITTKQIADDSSTELH